jgi:O-antigen/teichoic acid export membrane protein
MNQGGAALAEQSSAEIGKISVFSREFIFGKVFTWLTRGGLAIIDYGLISGSNFILGVMLARWLTPSEYGAYALAFSIFVLIGFLYQALLLEPLSVFSGTTFRGNTRGYLKVTAWIHWALCLVMCLLLASAAVIARVVGHSTLLSVALAGMTLATPFLLVHSLGRRSFYLELAPGRAAFASIFYCILVIGGVFLVYSIGWLSSFTAFLLMGFGALISSIVMVIQLNRLLGPATWNPTLRETWAKHWKYGRWALGTCVVGWIPNYVYVPLVSSFSGMAAAGELRALSNLAAPVLQTYAALGLLFLPYAARVQHEGGGSAASSLTGRLAALFVAGSVVYWAIILPLKYPLFHMLYAGKYAESIYLIPLFALETTIWSASLGPAIMLRAMDAADSLFVANIIASGVALFLGIPATRFFGIKGVIWSMIAANSVYVAAAFVLHARKAAMLKASETVVEMKSFDNVTT